MHLLVKGTTRPLSGEVVVPNSKYHAHRALMLASLAPGTSQILGLSDAGHVQHTVALLRGLGTTIDVEGDTFVVKGGPYHPNRSRVSVGSSGTTLYFMIGLSSLADRPVTVTGQKYFKRRPVVPLLKALTQMGVELTSTDGCPPIDVAAKRPTGGHVTIPGTLSQWISGLLLLAPFATGPTVVDVEGELNERPYLQLTISMMRQFGLEVTVSHDWRRFEIEPGQEAKPTTVRLPADIGSAAFGLAAAALHPSDLTFHGLNHVEGSGSDHPEAHFLDIIAEMGLPMTVDPASDAVRVAHDGITLSPTTVDCRNIPDMLPILSTVATFAKGTSRFYNVAHVRLKESDRVSAMLQLNRMGGRLELHGDELVCEGVDGLVGTDLSSFNDHRVLMSLAVAATRAQGSTTLTFPNAYRISYPRFLEAMNIMGMPMSVEAAPRPTTRRSRSQTITPDQAASITIVERVREWATRQPDQTAIIDVGTGAPDQTWTWAQLVDTADRVAGQLVAFGVEKGDTVALQLPNWAEFVVTTLATLSVGAICCPLMPIFREREMAYALARSRARVLIAPTTFRGRHYPAELASLADQPDLALEHVVVVDRGGSDQLPGAPWTWHRWVDVVAGQPLDPADAEARRPVPIDRAQLLFTSGTSGEPKGVLHPYQTLNRAAAMEVRHLGLTPTDRIYIPTPLAHQTGFLYGMWLAFLLGSPQIVQAVWDPAVGRRALTTWGGTFVQAATPFLADLVRTVETGHEPPPAALRIFVATGAAVPRGLAERATRVLGTAVCGAWGTTETCLGTLAAPGDEPAKVWGTDGRALEGVEIRVTDDDGRILASDQEGNFEVRSQCLFEGYLDHPEWTAEALTADGWYRSGDLAAIDEAGYIRIRGRKRDLINRGGEKIPVAEIEQLLYNHPAIADVAIVAMPDERLGERACAFAVLEDGAGLSFAQMQEYLDGLQVAKHYWPERLEVIDDLPRNASGKIQKFLLRERAQQLRPTRESEPRS